MQDRSQATYQQILASAQKQFTRSGYSDASVDEICADAGVSKGAFYHHFPSKHAAFMALLEDWLKNVDHQMASLENQSENVPKALIRMAGMLRFIFRSAGGQLPMFLEFWAQASRDQEVWQTTIAPYRRYHQLFTHLIERGLQEGSLQSSDPQLTAWVILALATGVLLQGLLDPQGAAWEDVAEHGMQVLMKGLGQV
jgi:AcrR family transcriptional regulator